MKYQWCNGCVDVLQRKKPRRLLPEDDKDHERRAAWIAIRCATALAEAQRSRIQLSGHSRVSSQTLGDKTKSDIPEYLALDLMGCYVLGEKKRVYKSKLLCT